MSNNHKNRRNFIKKGAILGMTGMALPNNIFANKKATTIKTNTFDMDIRPKVLFFDVNETLLDLTTMRKSVGEALGGREDLLSLWFTTMLQYSLVSTVARQYDDFAVIGTAALQMVAANHDITLSEEKAKTAIVTPLRSIPAHPEVKDALKALKADGYKLVSFTNSSNIGVKTQFENAGLIELFDERLSIEDIGKYKPDADAYQWAARKLKVQPNECFMIAAHGWDIAGAIWAGWRAAFISRPGAQLYPLAPKPEMNESDLKKISEKLISLKK